MALTAFFVWAIGTRRLRGPLEIVLLTFAASHVAAMIVAAPWTFHYKSILPLHAAFLFAAAFLLAGRTPMRAGDLPADPGRPSREIG